VHCFYGNVGNALRCPGTIRRIDSDGRALVCREFARERKQELLAISGSEALW